MSDGPVQHQERLGFQTQLQERLGEGAVILRDFVRTEGIELIQSIEALAKESPFRRLRMPNGRRMSFEMTNCGTVGWASHPKGYHYVAIDPLTQRPWPTMPELFLRLAAAAATSAGYGGFVPSVCLINRYSEGSFLQMHQDRDDTKDRQPVVSMSLGLPALFAFAQQAKDGWPRVSRLEHGDVVVFGGPSRMAYHGVLPLEPGTHPLTGDIRFSLTFRTVRRKRQRSPERVPTIESLI